MSASAKSRLLFTLGAAISPGGNPGAIDAPLREEDWRAFVHLVHRHRVAPLVARPSVPLSLPEEVRDAIVSEARQNAVRTVALMHTLRLVLDRLEEIGVRPVLLKGPSLGEYLYGAAERRNAGDLDLLIGPDRTGASVDALAGLGFGVHPAHGRRKRMLGSRAVNDECNDLVLQHPATGIAVELHWRPHHFRAWPDLFSDGREVERRSGAVGDVLVPSDRANLVYLSVHGALHLWRRLKWLADVAWLAHRRGEAALSGDLEFARWAGALAPVATALRLADRIVGCPVPAEIAQARPTRIEREILSGIVDQGGVEDGLRFRLSSYLTAFRLARGSRQKLGVVRYGLWRPLRLMAAGVGRR